MTRLMQTIRSILGGQVLTEGFKGLDEKAWFAVWSNNFKDREDEIFTEKAHDRYVARIEAKLVPLPELWVGHIKGSRIGQASAVWREGHMMVACGLYDETPQAKEAAKNLKRGGNFTMSHGFRYPYWAKKDGVYHDYTTFEISILPTGMEANKFTAFEEVITMPLTEELEKHLSTVMPGHVDKIKELANQVKKSGEDLEQFIEYKNFSDATPETPESKDSKSEADAAVSALLLDVLQTQADSGEKAVERAQAVDNMAKSMKELKEFFTKSVADLTAKVDAALEAVNAKKDELQQQIDEKPQRVDDAQKNVVDDADAQKAAADQVVFEGDPAMMGADKPPQPQS